MITSTLRLRTQVGSFCNDLDYLPVLWAAEGDYVLVENVSSAQQHASRLQRYGKQVNFVDKKGVDRLLEQIDKVVPWGWDSSIKFQLSQMGLSHLYFLIMRCL